VSNLKLLHPISSIERTNVRGHSRKEGVRCEEKKAHDEDGQNEENLKKINGKRQLFVS
jgi:hypothetical protein